MDNLWRTSISHVRERFIEAARTHDSKLVCVLTQYTTDDVECLRNGAAPAKPSLPYLGEEIEDLQYRKPIHNLFCDHRFIFEVDGKRTIMEASPFYRQFGKPSHSPEWFSANWPIVDICPLVGRSSYFYGSDHAFEMYRSIASDAGACLNGLTEPIKQVIWQDWQGRTILLNQTEDREILWTNAVFELSWQDFRGSILAADRCAWNGQFQMDIRELLARFDEASNDPDQIRTLCEQFGNPPRYFSVLEGMLNKSVAACDIILELGSSGDLRDFEPPNKTDVDRSVDDTKRANMRASQDTGSVVLNHAGSRESKQADGVPLGPDWPKGSQKMNDGTCRVTNEVVFSSEDCRSVSICGELLPPLTSSMAAAIKSMLRVYDGSHRFRHKDEILKHVKSVLPKHEATQASDLRDVFKGKGKMHPVWSRLVVSDGGGRGRYGLNLDRPVNQSPE